MTHTTCPTTSCVDTLKETVTFPGRNSAYSRFPAGGCQEERYSSDAVAAAISRDDPDDTSTGVDPHTVIVALASGKEASGGFSDQPFTPGSVDIATIMSVDDTPNADGSVTC
jgi:hypothetical protein